MISKTDSCIDIAKKMTYVYLIGNKVVLFSTFPALSYFNIRIVCHFSMVNTSDTVCEFLSDTPFFGLSVCTQFKLANCACTSGLGSTLEPWSKLGYGSIIWSIQLRTAVFEAARHTPETVEALKGSTVTIFIDSLPWGLVCIQLLYCVPLEYVRYCR